MRFLPLAQIQPNPAEDHDDPVHHKEQDDHAESELEHDLTFLIRISYHVSRISHSVSACF